MLKKGGILAPFWNLDLIRENEEDREFYAIVSKYGPVSCVPEEKHRERIASISSGIRESGLFTQPEVMLSDREICYSADEYYHYMLTSQVFLKARDSEKEACREEIKQYADRRNGTIKRRYTCELYLAQKL